MARLFWRHRSTLVCAAMAAAWALVWIRRLLFTHYLVLATTIHDDSFYYLLIAWNRARLGWFTFDGLTLTYGFQPVWELALVVLAKAVRTREALLRGALLAEIILYGAMTIVAGAAARAVWRDVRGDGDHGHLAAVTACAALLLNIRLGTANMTGKENALYGLVFATLLWLGARRRSAETATRSALRGSVAALGVLTRLSPMSLACACAQASPRGGWNRRALGGYAGGAVIVLSLWAAYAERTFGHIIPTSAVVKLDGFWADIHTWQGGVAGMAGAVTHYLLATIRFSLGFASPLWPAPDQATVFRWPCAVLVVAGLAWAVRHRHRNVLVTSTAVLAAFVTMPLLLHVRMSEIYYYSWYIVEAPILAAILAGVGMQALKARARAYGRALAAVPLVALMVFAGFSTRHLWNLAQPAPAYVDRDEWQQSTIRAAAWLNQRPHLARGGIAAFSAGILGWFSDAPVVNMDGLANDEVFTLTARGMTYEEYCRRRGLRVYVDPSPPSDSFDQFTTLTTFPVSNSVEFPVLYVTTIGKRGQF